MLKKTITILSSKIICFFILFPLHAERNLILDYELIENLTGAKGEYLTSKGVFKITVPHSDMKVSTAGIHLTPELGLTSLAAFKQVGDEVEVRGNFVIFEDQVNPILKAVIDNGLNVTSLNNHYLWDVPKIMFMSFEGKGSVTTLATSVGKVLETIKKTRFGTIWNNPFAHIDTTKTIIDVQNLEAILDKKGAMKNGVYKFEFDKESAVNDQDRNVSVGANTWAAFGGTNKQAVMIGDLAMEEGDVQNVLNTLIKNDVLVLSLHEQKMSENSRIFFLHFVKHGLAIDLAKNLKDSLESIKGKANEKTIEISENILDESPLEEQSGHLKKLK